MLIWGTMQVTCWKQYFYGKSRLYWEVKLSCLDNSPGAIRLYVCILIDFHGEDRFSSAASRVI